MPVYGIPIEKTIMETIRFYQPKELVFGDHCFKEFSRRSVELPFKRIFIIADPHVIPRLSSWLEILRESGKEFRVFTEVISEPTVRFFGHIRKEVEGEDYHAVIGIGGGSVMDTAKLIAALSYSGQTMEEVYGIGKVAGRAMFLACIPTTAGTGSEVSPNAVLLDQEENLKKGVVSLFLVPDMAYVDPVLTYSVPPDVSASTGIDALTHCLEAYTNKFAHQLTDLYALEGIRLIAGAIGEVCKNGKNAQARADLALGSLYGGLCLGPVNTAAVHALSYPLGGEYHIAHGISNAMLLPHVMKKNLPDAAERYAAIGRVIGAASCAAPAQQALECINIIEKLCRSVGIPDSLKAYNISRQDVAGLTASAMKVQRLLKNNLRDLNEEEISEIYMALVD